MRRAAWAAALGAYGAALALAAPAWPDDWDGVGLLASVSDFDLERFHPHPPGYPVYVVLLRAAAALLGSPLGGATALSAACGVAVAALAAAIGRRYGGERAAIATAALVGACPLAFRALSGVGSEAPALVCAAACVHLVGATGKPARAGLALGLVAALGMGVRLSWAPLFVAFVLLAPIGGRARAGGAAAAGVLAWAGPLALIVGPARLASLYAAHFAGHASRWGGTVVTEPGAVRAVWLARDVLVDGLGAGTDAPGLLVGALLVPAALLSVDVWRRARWAGAARGLVVAAPYLAWIALGQNLREQPRHALPLVALLAGALAVAASRSRRGPLLVAALGLALLLRSALDAAARRAIPPAGAQLVALARAQPAPARLAVFGTTSLRFFEGTELAGSAHPAGSLGDVQVTLARLDALPSRVWITAEVQTRGQSRWPIEPVATLCRPPRLDRRAPCLDVLEWRPPFLPSE